MKNLNIRNTASNMLYVVRLIFHISPKFLILAGIGFFLNTFEWVFYSAVFTRFLVYAAQHEIAFRYILLFLIGCLALSCGIELYGSYMESVVQPQADLEIRRKLYEKLYRKAENVELGCFENSDFYDRYMMVIENADTKIKEIITNFLTVLSSLLGAVITYTLLYQVDPLVILFAVFPVAGHFLFSTRLNKLIFSRHQDSIIFNRIADYVNRVVHLQDYAKEVRLTNISRLMYRKYEDSVKGVSDVVDGCAKKTIAVNWLYLSFSFSFIFESVLIYGGYRTIVSQTMSLPELAVLTSMMTTATFTLQDLAEALMQCFNNSLYVENFRSFLNYEAAVPEDSKGRMPEKEIRSVEFCNVSFAYKDKEPVLKNISFRVESPSTLALVGHNGAGKSTLIKLLMRLYDPTEGQILVNDIDIREYDLPAYRRLFSAAFQDGKLFSYGIRENILMRKPDGNADQEIVWDALKMAGMEQTVSSLEKGIDTVLTREFDKEGIVLSGGQYQKLVAARAFARETPLYVFDEPSSALDPIAEYELFDSIMKAGKGHILFLISHRLSSVQNSDTVLMLENGRIIEQGSHRKLMKNNGSYAALYRMQAKNYRAEEETNDFDDSIFTSHLDGSAEVSR